MRDRKTVANKAAVIAAYGRLGTVKAAVEEVGLSRGAHYDWMREDAEYAAAFASACEDRADILEKEAFRRAHDGTDKPVYWQGMLVGTIREYSDTLMLALLKAARPEKYRENRSVEVKDITPSASDRVRKLTDEQLSSQAEAARVATVEAERRTRVDAAGGKAPEEGIN